MGGLYAMNGRKWLNNWGPVMLWAGLIFWSSSQPYSEQDIRPLLSEKLDLQWVTQYLGHISFVYNTQEISVTTLGEAGFLEFFIRKGAHLFAYFMLSVLTCRALGDWDRSSWMKGGVALLVVSLYAVSDEFHQMFTAERTPLVTDVLIDITGGFLGIIIYHVFQKIKNTWHQGHLSA